MMRVDLARRSRRFGACITRTLARGAVLALFFGSSGAWATDVTLRLVDQNGDPIAASQFSTPVGLVGQEATVSLPAGTHVIRLLPGFDGRSQNASLYRDETINVSGTTQTIEFSWKTAPLSVEPLLDQHGDPIAASQFNTTYTVNLGIFPTGTTLTLPVTEDASQPATAGPEAGGYFVRLFPGLDGHPQSASLYRDHFGLGLSDGGASYGFVWKTASFTVEPLLDQFGDPILASQFNTTYTVNLGIFPTGTTLTLPVTEDASQPATAGPEAGGYFVRLFPGLDGHPQSPSLYRDHFGLALRDGGASYGFVWKTAPFSVEPLLDQHGDPIAVSQFNTTYTVNLGIFPTGTTLTLPVTEDASQPPTAGPEAGGYWVRLLPGIAGQPQTSSLSRDEFGLVHRESGTTFGSTWEVCDDSLHVVDASEAEVAGSSFTIESFTGRLPSGTPLVVPVNDDVFYPDLGGTFAGAYDVRIGLAPLDPLNGPFALELMSGSVFSPAFVGIGGGDFGLRCGLQPVSDLDHDGYPAPEDCDDSDPNVNPGGVDLPGDALDQDCDGEVSCSPAAPWKNHGAFVSCAAHAAKSLADAGRITEQQKDDLVEEAARSDVGKK